MAASRYRVIPQIIQARNKYFLQNLTPVVCQQRLCSTAATNIHVDPASREESARDDVKHGATSCQHPQLDLSFSSAYEAYRSKTTLELMRSLFVFELCSVNFLVNNNKQVDLYGLCNLNF